MKCTVTCSMESEKLELHSLTTLVDLITGPIIFTFHFTQFCTKLLCIFTAFYMYCFWIRTCMYCFGYAPADICSERLVCDLPNPAHRPFISIVFGLSDTEKEKLIKTYTGITLYKRLLHSFLFYYYYYYHFAVLKVI